MGEITEKLKGKEITITKTRKNVLEPGQYSCKVQQKLEQRKKP